MTDTNNILGENMLPLADIAKPVFNITPPHCPAQGGHQHPARPGIPVDASGKCQCLRRVA